MAQALAEIRSDRTEPALPAAGSQDLTPSATAAVSSPQPEDHRPQDQAPSEAATPAASKPAQTPEELQLQLQAMRSEIGRISALNRLHLEDQQEIRRLREQVAQSSAAREQQAAPSVEALQKLDQFREKLKDFPELNGLVEAVAEAVQQVDTRAEQRAAQAAQKAVAPFEPLRAEREVMAQREAQAAAQKDFQVLSSTYPGFKDVVQSPEFKEWVQLHAPTQVRDAFQNGQTPGEALVVLDSYDAFNRRKGGASIAAAKPAQEPAQAQHSAAATASVRGTSSKYERARLAAGVPGRSSGGGGAMPPQDDFESSLEFFRRQRLARQQAVT